MSCQVFFVESLAGGNVSRSPINHDVGKQLVEGELLGETAVITVTVRGICPRGELLENVGSQTDGAVHQSGAHSVRLGRLNVHVATFLKEVEDAILQREQFSVVSITRLCWEEKTGEVLRKEDLGNVATRLHVIDALPVAENVSTDDAVSG